MKLEEIPQMHRPVDFEIVEHRCPNGFTVRRSQSGYYEYLNQSVCGLAAFASVFTIREHAMHALSDFLNGNFGSTVYPVARGSD